MKQFLPVVWWLTATLVIAFVLVGLGYLFADALLLGVLFCLLYTSDAADE